MKKIIYGMIICAVALQMIVVGQSGDDGESRVVSKNVRLPRQAAGRDVQRSEKLSEPKRGIIPRAVVRVDDSGRAARVVGEINVDGAKNAKDAADKFLRENADKFKIEPLVRSKDLKTGLRVTDEIESLTGTHFVYTQFYSGLPVFDEHIKVSVNKNLQITNAGSNLEAVRATRGGFDKQLESRDDAIAAAVESVGGKVHPKLKPAAELGVISAAGNNPSRVYRVTFQTVQPSGSWEVLVNAQTGEVVRKRDRAFYAKGKGRVFVPNPVVSSGKFDFTDDDDKDTKFLNSQLKTVKLDYLDRSGNLSGKFANTELTWTFQRAYNKKRKFYYTRSDDRFEEVMAYYWVTQATSRLRLLGYKNLLNRSIPIDVNYKIEVGEGEFEEDYNAFYSPDAKSLNFGTGGVDTAEDATVILHEYGHALLDAQAPNLASYSWIEADAIHEAFGDYWAASFIADSGPQRGAWNAYMATWWAAGMPTEWVECYTPGNLPCLRRLDSEKHYPEDLDEYMEPHANSEIWSACLWQIWEKLGKDQSDKLILESNFRLPPEASFADAAQAILSTNRDLYKGAREDELRKIFIDRGILESEPPA